MADWSLLGGGADCKGIGVDLGTTSGVELPNSGVANTKSGWAEITSSLASDIDELWVSFSSANPDHLVDIGIGSAGSEVAIVENLYTGNGTPIRVLAQYVLPIRLASGTRLAVRAQSTAATFVSRMTLVGLRGSGRSSVSAGRIFTYGANTADSGGAQVDPGTSANTKGAWSVVSASTSADAKGFILAFGGLGDTTRSTCKWFVDVAIGAAGSEQVIIENFHLASRVEHDAILPQVTPIFPIPIPAGSRVAVRAQCDITTAGDRLFDVFLYALE